MNEYDKQAESKKRQKNENDENRNDLNVNYENVQEMKTSYPKMSLEERTKRKKLTEFSEREIAKWYFSEHDTDSDLKCEEEYVEEICVIEKRLQQMNSEKELSEIFNFNQTELLNILNIRKSITDHTIFVIEKILQYCPCQKTIYLFDKIKQTNCEKCKKPKDKAETFRYESIRSVLAAIFLNKDLMNEIIEKRKNRNKDFISSFVDSKTFENCNKDEGEYSFRFNVSFSAVFFNIIRYYGFDFHAQLLTILDLPDHLRVKNECSMVPMIYKPNPKNTRYHSDMCKLLFLDLMDLWKNGFVLTRDGVKYKIYINLVTLTGDSPVLTSFFEFNPSPSSYYQCLYCKIKKEKGTNLIKFKSYRDNLPEYTTTKELIDIYQEKRYGGRSWAIKGDSTVMHISEIDIIKISFPDPVRLLYGDVFKKILTKVLFNKEIISSIPTKGNLLIGKIKKINKSIVRAGLFHERKLINLLKFRDSNLEAIDLNYMKLLSHLFPFYFESSDYETDTKGGKIVRYFTELNSYIIAMFSIEVPFDLLEHGENKRNLIKEAFFQLMIKMEEDIDIINDVHLTYFFGQTTHLMLHLLENSRI
ncbi:hypothetical protein C6P42_004851 [Pichia californica]|nr:hypothetical protein C6P42_004851 [[Candida] californica]